MIKVAIDGATFRKLVKGEVVDINGWDEDRSGPARGVPVSLILTDIGFRIMLDAIKEAINEKDEADKDPDIGTIIP